MDFPPPSLPTTREYMSFTQKKIGANAIQKAVKEREESNKKVNLFTQKIESELQFKLICTAAQAKIVLSIGSE